MHVEQAHEALARAIGDIQLPDVLIEIDGLTRFSWVLLGRPARSEQELVTLYSGLLGLGFDLSVAELTRMVPSIAADSLGQMVLKIEADGFAHLRERVDHGQMATNQRVSASPSGLQVIGSMPTPRPPGRLACVTIPPHRDATISLNKEAFMRPFHGLVVALPVLASIVVTPLAPADARGRHDGGAAVVAGLLGLGIGVVAGGALGGRSYGYEPAYAPPAYAPVYVAPPPVYYAPPPPRIVYAPPPPIAYAPPGYYVAPPAYARHRFDYDRRRPVEAGWGDDD